MPDAHTRAGLKALESTPRALPWLAVLLATVTFAWLVRGLSRGLELTDESFYLLSAIHADSIRLFFTPTHWISGALWQTSRSLAAFRALGLALVAASALLLAWGTLRIAAHVGMAVCADRAARAGALATAVSGALLYGSLLNLTPSYNLLAASGAAIVMGLGLLSITSDSDRRSRILAAIAGITLGITVLSKFSSGICVGGFLLLLQLALEWKQPSRRLNSFLLAGFAALTVLAVTLSQTGVEEAWRQFRAGVEVVWFAQGDKSTVVRLGRSALDVQQLLADTARDFWGPFACFALALRWWPRLLGFVGAAWFAALLMTGDYLQAGMSRYATQGMAATAALILCLLARAGTWARSFPAALLVAVLAALPFAIALGSSNPLQVQFLTALASWGVLIGLFAFSIARPGLPAALIGLLFGVTVLLQVISNGAEPYRMRPYTQQSETATIGPFGTVKVDPATATLVRDIDAAAKQCRIGPGTPFLDFYNLPAVALMLGAVPVDTPWLLDAQYASLALKRADPAVLRRAVIAVKLTEAGGRPAAPSQLPDFPQGYTLCGRSTGPVDGLAVELWAPR